MSHIAQNAAPGALSKGTRALLLLDYISEHHPSFVPSVIVQVGANQGWELADYETFLPKKVVWIDAVADAIPFFNIRLEKLPAERQQAHSYVVALIAAEDERLMNFYEFSNKGAASSIYHGTPALFENWPSVKETGKVTALRSISLDTLLAKEIDRQDPIDLMVLDVQGAELECLKGASASLSRTRFLQVEISYEAIYEGGVLFDELNPWLIKQGFRLCHQKRFENVKLVGDAVYERV